MRRIAYILLCAYLFLNIRCGAQNKSLVQETPFTIEKSYVTSWVSENATSKRGTNIFISTSELPANIELEGIYFRNSQAKLQLLENTSIYKAAFYSGEEDYVLSSDMSKEKDNPLPKITNDSPVKLNRDQALLIYKESGKTKYYILDKLEDKGTKGPPPALMNSNN